MARKKSKQPDKSNRTFRERFELNTQKSVPRGAKRAIKTEKQWKVILWVMFSVFMIVLVVKTCQADKIQVTTLVCQFFVFVGIFTAIFISLRRMSCTYKKTKILHGEKVARRTVRTRRGQTRRMRLLPKRGSEIPPVVLGGFITVFGLFIGLVVIAMIRDFLIKLGDNQPVFWTIPFLFLPLLVVLSFVGFFLFSIIGGNRILQEHNYFQVSRKPPKTIVELDEHPLQIGRDYPIWIEQQGNYPNCHMECYMVMIKTEHSRKSGKSQEFQTECAKHFVMDMKDSVDITRDTPLKHEFTLSLDPEDYVPSVWICFSPGEVQQFDWVLRVFLVSDDDDILEKTGNNVLIQREFPLVLVT